MRRRFLILAGAALALGVAVLLYRGPGRGIVRGHVSDVAATMLVYAVVGLVRPRASDTARAVVTMAIALAMEVGQACWSLEPSVGATLLGTTFDAWDVVAYAVGTMIAVAFTRTAVK